MKRLNTEGYQKIHTLLMYAYVFSLPLFQKWSTVLLVMLTLVSLARFRRQYIVDIKPYILPVVLYLVIGLSLFYASELQLKYLENRASFVALPLVFMGIKINKSEFEKILKYFVWGCVTAVLICYANAFYNAIGWANGVMTFQPVVSGDFSFFGSVVRDGNYFFSGFFSIFHDTIYFAMYLNVALAGMLSYRMWKKNTWYILAMLLCALAVFQLSSKIGIVTCFLVFSWYLFLVAKNKLRRVLIPLTLLVVGGLFFAQNPRGKAMIEKFKNDGLTIEASDRFGYALRLMSWDAAAVVIGENPILGVGVADAQQALNYEYEKKGYSTPLKQNLNAHNTFLQLMMECGVLAVFLLLGMLYYLLRATETTQVPIKHFTVLFLGILCCAFLFESVLNRYSGIAFFMFFYGLLVNLKQHSDHA